jgi:hypothetical protein
MTLPSGSACLIATDQCIRVSSAGRLSVKEATSSSGFVASTISIGCSVITLPAFCSARECLTQNWKRAENCIRRIVDPSCEATMSVIKPELVPQSTHPLGCP